MFNTLLYLLLAMEAVKEPQDLGLGTSKKNISIFPSIAALGLVWLRIKWSVAEMIAVTH